MHREIQALVAKGIIQPYDASGLQQQQKEGQPVTRRLIIGAFYG